MASSCKESNDADSPLNYELVVKRSNELTLEEYHSIIKERIKVFVVEQNCPYQEVDDKDDDCIHVFFKLISHQNIDNFPKLNSLTILAYTRIVSPQYDKNGKISRISFGRVLVSQNYRNLQLGKKIVQKTIQIISELYPKPFCIKIGAQAHLQRFYGSFGFKPISEIYDEDGIPHIDMLCDVE